MNVQTPVVLITGAVTGIGRATALAFAREGANSTASSAATKTPKPASFR
jgi:NAD(P)-dependent dehydrogenase (short-subunit alcohol dehydrogenase family)